MDLILREYLPILILMAVAIGLGLVLILAAAVLAVRNPDPEKVRAYELQDHGFDTLEANLHLGFDGDMRRYDIAAAMLHALEVESIVLHTNNPAKVEGLRANGVEVVRREAIVVEARDENVRYLGTKKLKMGHII